MWAYKVLALPLNTKNQRNLAKFSRARSCSNPLELHHTIAFAQHSLTDTTAQLFWDQKDMAFIENKTIVFPTSKIITFTITHIRLK